MPSYGSASHAGSKPTRSAPRYAAISAASASASWGPGDTARIGVSIARARPAITASTPASACASIGRARSSRSRSNGSDAINAPSASSKPNDPPFDPDSTNRPRRVAAGPPQGSLPTRLRVRARARERVTASRTAKGRSPPRSWYQARHGPGREEGGHDVGQAAEMPDRVPETRDRDREAIRELLRCIGDVGRRVLGVFRPVQQRTGTSECSTSPSPGAGDAQATDRDPAWSPPPDRPSDRRNRNRSRGRRCARDRKRDQPSEQTIGPRHRHPIGGRRRVLAGVADELGDRLDIAGGRQLKDPWDLLARARDEEPVDRRHERSIVDDDRLAGPRILKAGRHRMRGELLDRGGEVAGGVGGRRSWHARSAAHRSITASSAAWLFGAMRSKIGASRSVPPSSTTARAWSPC